MRRAIARHTQGSDRVKHRRSASIVNLNLEEPNQIPPQTISPLLSAPEPGVIKYNVCSHCEQSLYFITRTPPFAWRSLFEWKYIPPEALSSPVAAAGLDVIHFNVC